MRLDGKTALVTGGASGFGEGIVRKFLSEGAQVMIADINGTAARELAASLGSGATAHEDAAAWLVCRACRGRRFPRSAPFLMSNGRPCARSNEIFWPPRNHPRGRVDLGSSADAADGT